MFWQYQHHHYLFCIAIPYVLVTRLSLWFAQFWHSQTINIFQFVFLNPTLITPNWMSSPHLILTSNSLFSPLFLRFEINVQQNNGRRNLCRIQIGFVIRVDFKLCLLHFIKSLCHTVYVLLDLCHILGFVFFSFEFSKISRENGNFNWNSHFIPFYQMAHNFISKKNRHQASSHSITIEIEF